MTKSWNVFKYLFSYFQFKNNLILTSYRCVIFKFNLYRQIKLVLSEYWHVNNLLGVIREFEAFRKQYALFMKKLGKERKQKERKKSKEKRKLRRRKEEKTEKKGRKVRRKKRPTPSTCKIA